MANLRRKRREDEEVQENNLRSGRDYNTNDNRRNNSPTREYLRSGGQTTGITNRVSANNGTNPNSNSPTRSYLADHSGASNRESIERNQSTHPYAQTHTATAWPVQSVTPASDVRRRGNEAFTGTGNPARGNRLQSIEERAVDLAENPYANALNDYGIYTRRNGQQNLLYPRQQTAEPSFSRPGRNVNNNYDIDANDLRSRANDALSLDRAEGRQHDLFANTQDATEDYIGPGGFRGERTNYARVFMNAAQVAGNAISATMEEANNDTLASRSRDERNRIQQSNEDRMSSELNQYGSDIMSRYFNSARDAEDFNEHNTYDDSDNNGMYRDTYWEINHPENHVLESTKNYYDYLTDEERETANYIQYAKGSEEMERYLQSLNLSQRSTEAKVEEEQWFASNHPIMAGFESIALSPLRGVGALEDNVNAILGNDIDVNSDAHLASNIQRGIRDYQLEQIEQNSNYGTNVKKFLYSTGMSMGDFMLTAAVTGGNEALSLGIMGTGAAQDTIIDAKNRGLSDAQAVLTGDIAGFAEIISEKISLEALMSESDDAVRYILRNFIAEGSEEVESDIINLVADTIINMDQSEFNQTVADLEAQGYSHDEAVGIAVSNQSSQFVMDFLGGAVSGGVMGGGMVALRGGSNALYNMENSRIGNGLNNSDSEIQNTIIQEGLKSEDEEIRNIAELAQLGEANNRQMGLLARAVSSENSISNVISKYIQGNGISAETAKNYAQSIVRYLSGNQMSQIDNLVVEGEIGQAVLNEIESGTLDDAYNNSLVINDALNMARNNRKGAVRSAVDSIKSAVNNITTNKNTQKTNTEQSENNNIEETDSQSSESTSNAKPSLSNIAQYREAVTEAQNAYEAEQASKVEVNSDDIEKVEIKKGKPVVELSDGTTVEAKNIKDNTLRTLTNMAMDTFEGDPVAINAFIKSYNDNVNIQTYVSAANTMIDSAINGYDYDTAVSKLGTSSKVLAQYIPTGYLRAMYNYGQNEANRRSSVYNSDLAKEYQKILYDTLGIKYTEDEDLDSANAQFDGKTGKVTFSKTAQQSRQESAAHEATHYMKKYAPESYSKLEDVVLQALKDQGVYDELFKLRSKQYESTDVDLIHEEMVSHATQEFFNDETFINKVCRDNPSLAEKLVNTLKQIIADIKKAIKNYKSGTVESDALKACVDFYQEAMDLYVEGLKIASENQTNTSEIDVEKQNVKKSIKNSQGGTLTEAQAEYFKDSKVRDDNGNLAVVYHGTPRGGFTVFKNDLNFFTTNKAYADGYQEPSASARVSGKEKTNAMTYEGYLNIKNPFDILNNSEARELFINEYIKGGWAQGINPYMSDAEIEEQIKDGIDWVEADNLKEFFDEEGYDYDGLVLNEGGYFDNDGNVVDRGTSYVTFDSNQFKNIDNENPTNNEDIRFSLKRPVEQTKDLIAVHNVRTENLMQTLELGGFPMPSLAVMKALDASGNSGYGDISVLFGKETIDPQLNSKNKVYSGDAWTPTFPTIDTELNMENASKVYSKIIDLTKKGGVMMLNSVNFHPDNLKDFINRNVNGLHGEASLVEQFKNDYGMKQAYLAEKDNQLKEMPTTETVEKMTAEEVELSKMFIDRIPKAVSLVGLRPPRAIIEHYKEEINNVRREYYKNAFGFTDEEIDNVFANEKPIDAYKELRKAKQYKDSGDTKVTVEEDRTKAREIIDSRLNQKEYEKWLGDLFNGLEGKQGIYNGKEIYTPSGNRKSWNALHYEVTLENVVKAMQNDTEKGGGAFGMGNPLAAATYEFSSIDDIKSKKHLLTMEDEETYQKIRSEYTDRFTQIATDAVLPENAERFGSIMDAGQILVDAVAKSKTKTALNTKLKKEANFINYSEELVDELWNLVEDIREMPTGYFEAKPQRAVGFDEVKSVILPDNAPEELIKALSDRNIPYETYKNGDETDRLNKLNAHDEVKFSKKQTENGMNYVQIDVDQKQFDGKTPIEQCRIARDIINNRYRNKTIANFDGVDISGNKQSLHYSQAVRRQYDDQIYDAKYRASTELKNLIEASYYMETIPQDELKGKHKEAVKGISKNRVFFKIGEQWFTGEINILNEKSRRVFYDITKIRAISDAESSAIYSSLGARDNSQKRIISYYENKSTKKSLKQYASDIKLSTKIDDVWESLLEEEYEEYLNSEEGSYLADSASILEEGFDALKALQSIGGANFTHNKAVQIARTYIQQYESSYGVENLANNIEAIFAYIQKNDVNYSDMIRVMKEVAKPILENTKGSQEYIAQTKPFRDYIKSLTISLNDKQKAEIVYAYGSMDNFRKATHGRINIKDSGVNIDNLWSEIVRESGNLLDIDEGSNTQIMVLTDLINSMADGSTFYDNRNDEQLAYDIALNIYTDFFKNVKADNADVTAIKEGLADNIRKYEAAVDLRFTEMVKQMEDAKAAEVENLKRYYKERLEEYKASRENSLDTELNLESMRLRIESLEAELDKNKKLVELNEKLLKEQKNIVKQNHAEERNKHYNQVKELKAEQRARLAEVRAQRDAAIEQIKAERDRAVLDARYSRDRAILNARSSRLKAIESRKKTENKNKIRKIVDDLNKMLTNPTDEKYIPKGLIGSTIDVLNAIDLNTGRSEAMAEKFARLKDQYEKVKSGYEDVNPDYDEDTYAKITRLRELFSDRSIEKLTSEEIEETLEICKAIQVQIKNANRFIKSEIKDSIFESGKTVVDEVMNSKGEGDSKLEELSNKYINASINAKRFFRRLVNYKDDSVLTKLVDEINEGTHKQLTIKQEVNDIMKPVLEGKENQKNVEWLTGQNMKDWIDTPWSDKNGNKIRVPASMRVSLAMHMMNGSNVRHIIHGGLTLPGAKSYHAGNISDSYIKYGHTIQLIDYSAFQDLKEKLYDDNLTLAEREEILTKYRKKILDAELASKKVISDWLSGMTDYERQVLRVAKQYFHEYSGKKINETSLELNGYTKARTENYFPIKTDRNFTATDIEGVKRDSTIEGWGNLKSRNFGGNPILLEDIMNVTNNHSDFLAKYAGLAIPIRNFNKVYKVTLPNHTNSVKHAIAIKHGAKAQTWIENLMTDLQVSRAKSDSFSKMMNTLRGNFAQAVLTINISVGWKQAASFPTAAATLGWDAIGASIVSKDGAALASSFVTPWWMKKSTKKTMELARRYTPLLDYRNAGNSTQELGDLKNTKTLLDHVPGLNKATRYLTNWIQNIDTTTVATLWRAAEYRVSKDTNLKKGTRDYYEEVARVFNTAVEDTQPNYTVMQRPDILRNQNEFLKQVFMFKTQPLQNLGIIIDAYGNLVAKLKDETATDKQKKDAISYFARAVSSQVVAAVVFSGMTLASNVLKHSLNRYRDDDDELTLQSILERFINDIGSCFAGALPLGSEIYDYIQSKLNGTKYYGLQVSVVNSVNDFVTDFDNLQNTLSSEEGINFANVRKYGEALLLDAGTIAGVPLKNAKNLLNGFLLHAEDISNGEFGTFEAGVDRSNRVQYHRWYEAIQEGDTQKADEILELLNDKFEGKDSKLFDSANMGGYIKQLFLDGEIDRDTAEEYLVMIGKDEGEAHWYMQEVEDPEMSSKYSNIMEAIDDGDLSDIKDAIDELNDYGTDSEAILGSSDVSKSIREAVLNGDIDREDAVEMYMYLGLDEETAVDKVDNIFSNQTSTERNDIKDDYSSGSISRSEAERQLVETGLDENEAHWKVVEWETGSSSRYANLYNAIETYDNSAVQDAIRELNQYGYPTEEETWSSITSHFKPIYRELYATNRSEAAELKHQLLLFYSAVGKDYDQKSQDIDKWLED